MGEAAAGSMGYTAAWGQLWAKHKIPLILFYYGLCSSTLIVSVKPAWAARRRARAGPPLPPWLVLLSCAEHACRTGSSPGSVSSIQAPCRLQLPAGAANTQHGTAAAAVDRQHTQAAAPAAAAALLLAGDQQGRGAQPQGARVHPHHAAHVCCHDRQGLLHVWRAGG